MTTQNRYAAKLAKNFVRIANANAANAERQAENDRLAWRERNDQHAQEVANMTLSERDRIAADVTAFMRSVTDDPNW